MELRKNTYIFEKKFQIRILLFDKALIKISTNYFYYKNIFLIENAIKLPKYIIINNYAIKQKKLQQQLFGLI